MILGTLALFVTVFGVGVRLEAAIVGNFVPKHSVPVSSEIQSGRVGHVCSQLLGEVWHF